MFATLIGPYPHVDGTPGERLVATIGDQMEAGLGMLSDGMTHRVTASGAAVADGAAVQAWRAADEVGHRLAALAGIDPPLIKACLLGAWSAGHRDAGTAADHLSPVIRALFEAGAPVVQLAEPAIGDIDPEDHQALDQLESVLASVTADVDGHLSLALVGGRPTRVPYERLFAAPLASYLFDLIRSPDDWRLCARVPTTCGLIVGVADARTAAPDATEVSIWGARYAASLAGRGPERVGLTTSAGLERLPRDAARAKLAALAEAGRQAVLPDAELAQLLDPRAIDARSAALGRHEPPPRRG